jgi:hypothetical protein
MKMNEDDRLMSNFGGKRKSTESIKLNNQQPVKIDQAIHINQRRNPF